MVLLGDGRRQEVAKLGKVENWEHVLIGYMFVQATVFLCLCLMDFMM
jgi:hypothetical protein